MTSGSPALLLPPADGAVVADVAPLVSPSTVGAAIHSVSSSATSVDWSDLPATGMAKVGVLAKTFLQQEELFLKQVYKNLNETLQSVGSGGDPFKLRAAINNMQSHLKSLESVVANIGSGRMKAVSLGPGITLDAAQIDYFERAVLKFTNVVGSELSASTALGTHSAASSVAAAAADDPTLDFIKNSFAKLSTTVKNLATDTSFTGAKIGAVAGVTVGAVAFFAGAPALGAAGAGLILGALGAFTYGYLYQGEQAAIIRNDWNAIEATVTDTMNQVSAGIDSSAAQFSAGASATSAKLLKVLGDVGEHAKQTVFIPANDFIHNNLLTFVNSVSVSAFKGTWTGSMSYTAAGHYYSDPITVTFTSGVSVQAGSLKLKLAKGTMKYVYRYLDPSGNTTKTVNLTASISGALWGTTVVTGVMKAHVPGGPYGTADFAWNFSRDTMTLSGRWVEGANANIVCQKQP